MGLRKGILALVLAVVALAPAAVFAEGKFSAQVFGDYYYFAESHDSLTAEQNGFWIRRVYLTWDEKFDDTFSARVRLETGSAGSFLPGEQNVMVTFVKDAWIRWKSGQTSVILGLSDTPSHSFTEGVWGYRYLEKIPGDLQRYYSSRDMGIAVKGDVGEAKRFGYHVMFGNGSSTRNEIDSKKKVSGSVHFWLTQALVLEAYGDFEARSGNQDRTTFRGFASYKADKLRAGAEYVMQTRDRSDGTSFDLSVVSGFAAGAVSEKVWLVGRVDRTLDAGVSDPGAPYFTMDGSVKSTFILAGVEFQARENISFTPNVEMALYDDPEDGSEKPDNDIVGRFTFMFKY